MQIEIDEVDRRILALLQVDASLGAAELARQVGLSQSVCWRRVDRLVQAGVILRRVALLDRAALGFGVMVFAQIKFARSARQSLADFEATVRAFPEVLECHMLMGEVDFLLKVVTRDVAAYQAFLRDRLSSLPAVQEVRSSMALTAVKESTELPL